MFSRAPARTIYNSNNPELEDPIAFVVFAAIGYSPLHYALRVTETSDPMLPTEGEGAREVHGNIGVFSLDVSYKICIYEDGSQQNKMGQQHSNAVCL